MRKINDITPYKAVHPGELLADELKERKKNLFEFSIFLGLGVNKFLKLLQGEEDINEVIADRLEKLLNIPKDFWINLQNQYDEDVKRIKDSERKP